MAPSPIGMVTDRDIMVEVLGKELDPARITLREIMRTPAVIASASEDVAPAVERMKAHGVRRIPVVDETSKLAGIPCLDDLLKRLANDAAALIEVVTRDQIARAQESCLYFSLFPRGAAPINIQPANLFPNRNGEQIMRTDSEIQTDVEAELKWAPDVNDTDIAVKVTGGAVTLTGYAVSYQEKYRAEVTAKNVLGVAAVANDLAVRAPLDGIPADPDIARDAVAALRWGLPLACKNIQAIVKDGHVALEGTVDWHYERERAEAVVRRLRGVMGVRNSITLRKRVAPPEIKHKIEDAFRRNAIIDAQKIAVEARGSDVTLRGEVRSWAERDQAERTAWAAPGVATVRNEITVRI